MNKVKFEVNNIAEVKITYTPKILASMRPKVSNSKEVAEIFRKTWNMSIEHKESFKVMYLNKANKILGIQTISIGGVSGTVVDLKIIFQGALKANASSIILAHNHPSGDLKPSNQDRNLTEKIRKVGISLELLLLDHIIITAEKFYSFSDEGLI